MSSSFHNADKRAHRKVMPVGLLICAAFVAISFFAKEQPDNNYVLIEADNAYWSSNIDLTDVLPELDLYDRSWPIWTHAEITPPAKFVHDEEGRRGEAVTSLVSGGCIISGAALRRSLLFTGVHLHSFAKVKNAVILPYVDVGEDARLANVVIDRGVRIPDGLVVGEDPELDAKRFRTTRDFGPLNRVSL
jgi:ADP-glucose pyrophosphorylase